ncbi:hypothetical protein CN498_28430 [Bacillus thuringiensis]|uniref:Uncharacterized protein n=1 Tax=Bacillus cereus (strain G9842) TaxID=405531 RepID=B7ITS8_BACC2|nr:MULTISPECIES: hypothetical protein [Bacillus cereus group]ACK93599.1 conserved hypothetical protein [Bacillus cereus G9842]MDR4135218.1 hypothetical protein [Bacillus cereus]MDR4365920.1 hypothetical protein [Bacillus cereus]PER82198.1 hypothetical protein CN498_28430 [Bacillus thuringiensis]
MIDFEKEVFQEIKLKKKINHLSDENKKMKKSIKVLLVTVEELRQAFINLQNNLRRKVSEEDILEAIVNAIEDVKEID